jgi:uncharacterized phosphosugar-binding protein
MNVSAAAFATAATRILGELVAAPDPALETAADMMAASLAADGVVQAFGTGHSQAAALEVAGRAGGLIPTNRIALTDAVIYGGRDPRLLSDPLLERSPGLAAELLDLVELSPADVFIVVSNSGINASIVDMALEVTARGYPLIAITSTAHGDGVVSRHPSGKRLRDLADVVIDNHAPYGDTLLPMGNGASACAISSITTAFIIQMLVAETVRRLEDRGIEPPVYVSANVPGGHERNIAIEARYGARLRRWAA